MGFMHDDPEDAGAPEGGGAMTLLPAPLDSEGCKRFVVSTATTDKYWTARHVPPPPPPA